MTFRVGGVLVAAAFAIFLLGSLGTSAKAETVASDGKDQTASVNRNHRAHAKSQPQKETTALPPGPAQAPPSKPNYREVFWQPFGWGAPPRQDSRDAYQGYFANPVDNPRSFGSVGRATQIFRQ
jgi:hypothetical protein